MLDHSALSPSLVAMASNELLFKLVSPEEIQAAVEIEQEGYPADEAGTLESFRFRQINAGDLFLGAYLPPQSNSSPPQLIGYVCSTLSPEEKLTHASMSNHVPGSSSVCIHSVCISKSQRRKGIALQLLKEYISRLSSAQGSPYKRVLLIAHEELRPLYEKAGFAWLGKSDVTHGSRPWYELRLDLGDKDIAPQIPPDVLQNLLRPSSEKHNPTLVSDCHHGLDDLIMSDSEGTAVNKYDLLCPRGCRSIILKKGVAQWTERTSVMKEAVIHSYQPSLHPQKQHSGGL
ncbi:hypothetical protein EST38_g5451 [Candolleomyces aberdarensis]|uniref:N-acetyltransferase domain-containing protein n=1 Tax=Candolleomyces aberdarensis TaxID=2316362 RepID=A0A4Q2DM57_9AGAR|nr:hypothetical protein EST38_g5451 [Candolleomyces aberdarensis]